jgi:hypothetical protein
LLYVLLLLRPLWLPLDSSALASRSRSRCISVRCTSFSVLPITVRVEPDDASEKEGSGVWVADTVFIPPGHSVHPDPGGHKVDPDPGRVGGRPRELAESPTRAKETYYSAKVTYYSVKKDLLHVAESRTRATQPGLVSPGGSEQARRCHPASLLRLRARGYSSPLQSMVKRSPFAGDALDPP